ATNAERSPPSPARGRCRSPAVPVRAGIGQHAQAHSRGRRSARPAPSPQRPSEALCRAAWGRAPGGGGKNIGGGRGASCCVSADGLTQRIGATAHFSSSASTLCARDRATPSRGRRAVLRTESGGGGLMLGVVSAGLLALLVGCARGGQSTETTALTPVAAVAS